MTAFKPRKRGLRGLIGCQQFLECQVLLVHAFELGTIAYLGVHDVPTRSKFPKLSRRCSGKLSCSSLQTAI